MRTLKKVLATVAATVTTAGLGTVTAPSAAAAPAWANDTYDVCSYYYAWGGTSGGIIWGNRTSEVQGSVTDVSGDHTVAYFDAFAGSTKVASTTRTASYGTVPYHFFIGDPNLVGGIDRIRIQVCTIVDVIRFCGPQENEVRD